MHYISLFQGFWTFVEWYISLLQGWLIVNHLYGLVHNPWSMFEMIFHQVPFATQPEYAPLQLSQRECMALLVNQLVIHSKTKWVCDCPKILLEKNSVWINNLNKPSPNILVQDVVYYTELWQLNPEACDEIFQLLQFVHARMEYIPVTQFDQTDYYDKNLNIVFKWTRCQF